MACRTPQAERAEFAHRRFANTDHVDQPICSMEVRIYWMTGDTK
jgi:hypothetical protein